MDLLSNASSIKKKGITMFKNEKKCRKTAVRAITMFSTLNREIANIKRKLLLPTFVCFLTLFSGVAAAVVIDFEDLTPTSTIFPIFGAETSTTLTSRGFVFDSPFRQYPDNSTTNHAHLVSSPFNGTGSFPDQQFYASNGTQYIGLDPSIIKMTSTSSVPFNLLSFDAAEGFLKDPDFQLGGGTDTSNAALFPLTASGLEVEGTFAVGGTVSAVFSFDGINDSVIGTAEDFESFVLPAGFVELTSVSFHGLNAASQRAFQVFSIDNVATSLQPVPEPSTLLLLGVGLAALCTVRASRTL